MVERQPSKLNVASSSLVSRSNSCLSGEIRRTGPSSSGVERILGKDEVAGSNPALGSSNFVVKVAKMVGDVNASLKMVYWKSDHFWLGKSLDHREIMTQCETLEELEENIRDAYLLMAMDEVPNGYQVKEIWI